MVNKSDFILANPKLRNDLLNYDLDQDVTRRLSYNLSRTYYGNSDVYLTPIAEKYSPDVILKDFNDIFEINKGKLNSPLLDLEYSNKAKFGPRSITVPWSERSKSLSESFEIGNRTRLLDMTIPQAILRPISVDKALTLLKNSTNSGLPHYTRKGLVKQRTLDDFDKELEMKYPCILFTRSQENKKTRDVWGYPMSDTLREMMYYKPLLDYQRKLNWRAALHSPDMVSKGITDIIKECSFRVGYSILSIDFSSFDKNAKYSLQMSAFNYIKSLYQAEHRSQIDSIFERFNTIGIVTPDGVLKGNHGIPSGSTFTNEVGSIIQYLISSKSGLNLKDFFQIQGDDGVYLVPDDKVDEFIRLFESYGLTVSRDKSYVSKTFAIYLQSLFSKDYMKNGIIGGIYPVYRALNRILFQERWSTFEDYEIEGKDYYSIRTICILENCKYHPLFEELVKIILKYDKYSLDISDQGLSKYVQMIEQTQGAGEILNQQYGSNVRGLKQFESYKLVKKLG